MLDTFRLINADLNPDADVSTDILLDYFQPSELQQQYCELSQIYVFGDSLSDIGNTFDLMQQALGEGLPPAPPYFARRFSNGPVWVEYLARFLKLPSSRHTNFAAGGATTGSLNTFIPNNPHNLPGLQQQIEKFTASLQGAPADSNALYIVWVGANDYFGGGSTDPTVPIANLSNAIQSLVNAGAKQLMVVNLPDLGDLPSSQGNPEVSNGLNALTHAHNTALATSIQALQHTAGSDVQIMLFDVNGMMNQLFLDPAKSGFTNIADTELEKLSQFQGYADTFFFWDRIHPTTTAHLTLAKTAVALLTPVATAVS
ncbi:SGNH/GDSL hydrolase family protein [Leptolyngbya sp. NIES-2104]|uniref:SGNH/GDSL hydrolase family protein n=1 Tax=Leptolyngbya sp. NIES-2104 TaxID=1552121 RepID=UPI0006EC7888|nr:SGNH/GDSL hydrolase family protein [Leptolyngbya sp. NIES-2104]GAP94261.1 phospholipase/lecithinase/hemolysin [Leptolyngbya sp. NIES-2104]